MRTMTTINWGRSDLLAPDGRFLGTRHTGSRGSWSFTIDTPRGERPTLKADRNDGHRVVRGEASLKAAKNVALELMHPAEAMAWTAAADSETPVTYRAHWDAFVFVVFTTADGSAAFQWRNTETDERSQPVPVEGVREARQLAASILYDRFPVQAEETNRDADYVGAVLSLALRAAGVATTPARIALAVEALLGGSQLEIS